MKSKGTPSSKQIEVSSMPAHGPDEETSRFEVKGDGRRIFPGCARDEHGAHLDVLGADGDSLIGFGFTIFQFLHRFNQTPGIKPPVDPWTPWVLGLRSSEPVSLR